MLISWYVRGVELSLTCCQSLPVPGTNLKSGHYRQDDCTAKGGYGQGKRLLYIRDVAESIRNESVGLWWWTPSSAPVPSLRCSEEGQGWLMRLLVRGEATLAGLLVSRRCDQGCEVTSGAGK